MSNEYVINTMYYKPVFERDFKSGRFKKIIKDALIMNVKDVKTGEVNIKIIEEPLIDFYITKEDKYAYPKDRMALKELDKVTCKYCDRSMMQANALGLKNAYFSACREGWYAKKMFEQNYLYNSPRLYGADIDIEDFYINNHQDLHGRKNLINNLDCIKQGHADIEVDQNNYTGDKVTGQNPAVPVNLIVYITEKTKRVYIFMLNNNDSVDRVFNNKENFLITHLLPLLKEKDRQNFKYIFYKFDYEEDLIEAFFKKTHEVKDDFIEWWHINFDIPYLMGRMDILGMDKNEIMCHPDVPKEYRRVYYIEDSDRKRDIFDPRNKAMKHYSRMWDWPIIPGYTQHYDGMSLYSNLRKRYILPSYKLDDIGETETGYTKVDYRSKGYNIRTLAHKNYELFVSYGVFDVILELLIESSTEDLKKYLMFSNNTRLSKGTGISYRIYNNLYRWFKDKGEVMGNTVTYNISDEFSTNNDFAGISGAVVANPDNLLYKILIFKHVVDFDEKTMYPNIMKAFNIYKTTIWGRIYRIINETTGEILSSDGFNFNTALQTIDLSLFDMCNKFFGLPNLEDIMLDIENKTQEKIKIRKT